jgi:hypothetical protein
MSPDKSDVDKAEWVVLDLRNDTVAVPLDIEDNPIVGPKIRASEGGAKLGRAGPLGPFDDGEPQAKWPFGVLMLGPEGDKRPSIENTQQNDPVTLPKWEQQATLRRPYRRGSWPEDFTICPNGHGIFPTN